MKLRVYIQMYLLSGQVSYDDWCLKLMNRAVSGISGSRVPDNHLGYPNRNFGSGTRNDAWWEEMKDNLTSNNAILKDIVGVSVI